MPSDKTFTITCPAKVNLALSVAKARDDGMHPIASWMVALTLGDRLTLTALEGDDKSTFDIRFDTESDVLPTDASVDWPIENDLAFRAHQLAEEHVGRPLPVSVDLLKRTPTGGGLGGGSSDAAGMFVGLNQLFDLQLGDDVLIEMATQLGSDIAFFIAAQRGTSSAVVHGLGESIEPAPRNGVLHLVLAFPPFGCPTGPVYGAFDRLHPNAPAEPDLTRVRKLAQQSHVAQDAPFNDLTDAACAAEPRLRQTLDDVRDAMGVPVHVTGSGSTLFLIAPSALTAGVLARKVTATTGLPSVATRTV